LEYFYLFLAALLWSTSFPLVKWGLSYLNPLSFLFFRFLIAFIFFVPFLNFKNLKKNLNKDLILLGILSAGGYIFQFMGQKYTLAGRTSLFINLYVIWVPLILYFLKKQKFEKFSIISIFLSISGLFLLFYKTFGKFEIEYIKGDFLTLLSSLLWSFYIIIAKRILNFLDPFQFSGIVILLTAFFLLPFSLIDFKIPKNFQGYYAIFHLSFFCTFFAYFLYHIGLSKTSEFKSSLFLLLEVIFAVIFSFIFLKEKFTFIQMIGGILIIFGIFFGTKKI